MCCGGSHTEQVLGHGKQSALMWEVRTTGTMALRKPGVTCTGTAESDTLISPHDERQDVDLQMRSQE